MYIYAINIPVCNVHLLLQLAAIREIVPRVHVIMTRAFTIIYQILRDFKVNVM